MRASERSVLKEFLRTYPAPLRSDRVHRLRRPGLDAKSLYRRRHAHLFRRLMSTKASCQFCGALAEFVDLDLSPLCGSYICSGGASFVVPIPEVSVI
jgi:hypothetical protein